MADKDDATKTTSPAETDAEKAEREQRERDRNAAEATVKGWVEEAIKEHLPLALKSMTSQTHSSSAPSNTNPNRKKSVLESILHP